MAKLHMRAYEQSLKHKIQEQDKKFKEYRAGYIHIDVK